jgi:hypothetical protein
VLKLGILFREKRVVSFARARIVLSVGAAGLARSNRVPRNGATTAVRIDEKIIENRAPLQRAGHHAGEYKGVFKECLWRINSQGRMRSWPCLGMESMRERGYPKNHSLCPQCAMVYASDRLPMRNVGVRKLLGNLIRPTTVSAEDECQIYISYH